MMFYSLPQGDENKCLEEKKFLLISDVPNVKKKDLLHMRKIAHLYTEEHQHLNLYRKGSSAQINTTNTITLVLFA